MWLLKTTIELGEGKTTVKIGNKIPQNIEFYTPFFTNILSFHFIQNKPKMEIIDIAYVMLNKEKTTQSSNWWSN